MRGILSRVSTRRRFATQFGGDISGPIVKDKGFFFFNTEEQLREFPLISSIINPSLISGSGANATWRNWAYRL